MGKKIQWAVLIFVMFILALASVSAKSLHQKNPPDPQLEFVDDNNQTLINSTLYILENGNLSEFTWRENLTTKIVNLSEGFKFGYYFYPHGIDNPSNKTKELDDYKVLLVMSFNSSPTRIDNSSFLLNSTNQSYVFNYSDLLLHNFTVEESFVGEYLNLTIYKNWTAAGIFRHSPIDIDPSILDYFTGQSQPPPPAQSGSGGNYFSVATAPIKVENTSLNMTLPVIKEPDQTLGWIALLVLILIVTILIFKTRN